ncbi:hypothetical protein FHU10_4596 [Serratia fonticola]|uniref:Virulence effector protein n=1 Tax=Serratia fonticola TaxID=47917 RepID=A0A542D2Y7_SERFO|nr:SrfA family protein [Serratia fonticola]TQI80533.1 hypothetical protein FHU09_3109 [Serratia fonticola]TQI97442.1 hypothetical protein FHU11_2936 [Serratia fonticola]TVZ71939.1 hypothetical protein FHU10_4596 [Serratia fonticola]
MAKPFLRSGSLDDVLTLGENGQPIYAVAAQLREALRIQQQQAVADCLAIPVPSEQGERIDWYAPITGRVISWNAADASARAAALHQLVRFHTIVEAISLRAQNSGKVSQQLFAALLTKAMQFPDQNAVFLVDGKPVITFWGCVKADGKTRNDPLDCLRLEQDSATEPFIAPLAEIAVPPIPAPAAAPDVIPPIVNKKPQRLWWSLPVVAALALLFWWFILYPSVTEAPAPTVEIVAPAKVDVKPARPLVGLHLPLSLAEVIPPPVVAPVVVDKLALTLPAESVKIGSTAFLNGKWRATLAVKDPLTGKLPSLLYQFKNGKGTARITQGDKVTCRVEVSAGLMQSGNLVINSRTKARCSDGSRYQMPELVCKQGDAGAADCSGRYGTETVFPMTIKRENK